FATVITRSLLPPQARSFQADLSHSAREHSCSREKTPAKIRGTSLTRSSVPPTLMFPSRSAEKPKSGSSSHARHPANAEFEIDARSSWNTHCLRPCRHRFKSGAGTDLPAWSFRHRDRRSRARLERGLRLEGLDVFSGLGARKSEWAVHQSGWDAARPSLDSTN